MKAALRVEQDQHLQIVDFMSGFTLETTSGSAAKIADFRDHVRPGTAIYITFLPGSDIDDTIVVAKRLANEGFKPVPHIAARSIPNRNYFEEKLRAMSGECGVTQVLCIAGDIASPVGEFSDTMQLLDTGLLDKYGIIRIGLAGHPEGSPDIPEQALKHALKWKNEFAKRTDAELYLVTQFCFEAEPIIKWDKQLRAEGNRLPIHIGIPGLATIKTLLNHAKACGVGPSMRFLSRQAMNIAKLMTVSAPDKLVMALAAYKASDSHCGILGVHMFPLGGLKKSADWSYAVVDGNFRIRPDGNGFDAEMRPS